MALEEFTSGGSRDFRQRYAGVYGFFPDSNKNELLVKVTEVTDNRMHFMDARGIQYTAYADKGVHFKFIPVTKRLFFMGGSLVLALRKPARQYQRGICEANTSMQTVYGNGIDVDYDSITAYLVRKYSDKNNYLLNDYLAIHNGNVYLYNQVIGTFHKEGRIRLNNSLFRQELVDALRENNLPYTVEVLE